VALDIVERLINSPESRDPAQDQNFGDQKDSKIHSVSQADPTLWFTRQSSMIEPTHALSQTEAWLKRMFASFVIHAQAFSANDDYAQNYRFELFYDMDEYLETHHSLAGCSGISLVDIMLFSYLRRYMDLNHADCLKEESLEQTMPELAACANLKRLVIYIAKTF